MISPSIGGDGKAVTSARSPAGADEKGIVDLEACADIDVTIEPDAIDNTRDVAADNHAAENGGGEPDADQVQIVREAIDHDDDGQEPQVVPHPSSTPQASATKSTLHSMFTTMAQDMFDARVLFYLSIFSIIGSILRVFIGRLFGLDCEGLDVDDVFHEAFAKICVTATGETEQTGGALFIDLPANMIGSMMMGVMTSGVSGYPSIPWLKAEHPLQQHKAMNIAIRTGLCGSLTTFASWNSQMVVMLDGFQLPLGHQILPAIFGYVIGLQASIASFLFGRKANIWINQYVNPHVCSGPNRNVEQRGTLVVPPNTTHLPPTIGDTESNDVGCRLLGLVLHWVPVIFVVVVFSLFVVSDVLWNIPFYRILWVSILFTPFGAILRWRLSLLNPYRKCANVLGSVIAVLAVAIGTRYLRSETLSAQLLAALKIGFAGSLSTVSTFVKEVVDITERHEYDAKGHKYAAISLVTCCAAGVVVYSPIVRS